MSSDLISRQAVLDLLFNSYIKTELTSIGDASKEYAELCVDELKELPSVNPQEPKTGHWIDTNSTSFEFHRIYNCSECGNTEIEYPERICERYKYCPNCGCRMVEPQESEIHCNCTDAEIAKSFIEDVEAVKDLLPRAEMEG